MSKWDDVGPELLEAFKQFVDVTNGRIKAPATFGEERKLKKAFDDAEKAFAKAREIEK